jgi:hypothetical protein
LVGSLHHAADKPGASAAMVMVLPPWQSKLSCRHAVRIAMRAVTRRPHPRLAPHAARTLQESGIIAVRRAANRPYETLFVRTCRAELP